MFKVNNKDTGTILMTVIHKCHYYHLKQVFVHLAETLLKILDQVFELIYSHCIWMSFNLSLITIKKQKLSSKKSQNIVNLFWMYVLQNQIKSTELSSFQPMFSPPFPPLPPPLTHFSLLNSLNTKVAII